jgi:hypothetical protein
MPCSPLKANWRFGGTCRLYRKCRRINQAKNQRENRWQAEVEASETTADFQRTTWRYISDDRTLQSGIVWRARCRSTVNSGNACLQPLLGNATIGGTVVLFGVRSGNEVIQQYRNRRRCFLCGLFPGYIARVSTAMMGQSLGVRAELPSRESTVKQHSSEKSCRVAGERILQYWKTGNQWRYSVKTRQVL